MKETMSRTQPWEDDLVRQAVRRTLDPGDMPPQVQERLSRTYASFGKIPQERECVRAPRRVRRGMVAVGIAAACALFAGAAYAAGNLIQMQAGEGAFFASGRNLPVFDSMEAGARLLSAPVGQSVNVDGVQITLDEISCDRNVANLYLTLEREGGFDLTELAGYEGSEEGEWAKLQNALPVMGYTLRASDGTVSTGDVRRLDAYRQDGAIVCLMRIVPESTMPDQVQLDIGVWADSAQEATPGFSVGMDLSNVALPRELGVQELTFNTTQGEKRLDIGRFTVSDLACVLVTHPQVSTRVDDEGRSIEGVAEDVLDPSCLKVTDGNGAVLYPVDAGDGQGVSIGEARVIELAGATPVMESVTFTPVLADEAAMEAERQERVRAMQRGEEVSDGSVVVDVSQIGTKVPLTDLGGYEVTGWNVEGSTVTIKMKPYGWVPPDGVPELIAEGEVTPLAEEWTDPETGQSGVGEHHAIRFVKWDHATGEVMQIDAYYKATPEELSAIRQYRTFTYPSGWYVEEAAAAQTLALS